MGTIVICATTPTPFVAVGESYWNFTQMTDEGVRRLLREAAEKRPPGAPRPTDVAVVRFELVPTDNAVPADDGVPSDETSAVEPLERTARWEEGEIPETYPVAV